MKLRITVHGVAYEVDVDVLDDEGLSAPSPVPRMHTAPPPPADRPVAAPRPAVPHATPAASAAAGDSLVAPIAGTVIKVLARPGQTVAVDEVLLVIEAMKMNTEIASDRAGTVRDVPVKEGESVREGQVLVSFQA